MPRADFTDAGLESLAALPDLIQLRFGSPRVTDAGMKALAKLPALKRLHLIDVPITDAGLAEIAKMNVPITDAGLAEIKVEGLQSLYIDGARFSDAALDNLFRQRPGLHVHFDQQHHDRDPQAHAH